MFPVHAAGDNFIESLKQDTSVFEVFEEGLHGGIYVEGVEPECEDTGFALAFCVKVFYFGFFGFVEGREAGVVVEEVCHEGEIQFGISGDEGGGSEVFSAVEFVGVLEDLFGSLEEVSCLEWGAGTFGGVELVEEDSIIFTVLDVLTKVPDSTV